MIFALFLMVQQTLSVKITSGLDISQKVHEISSFRKREEQVVYEMMLGEQKTVRYLDNMGVLLNISLFHHNILDNTKHHICSSVEQKVQVIETQDSFREVIPRNALGPQVNPLEQERIVSMVHTTDGVFIVTNMLRGFQYRFQKSIFLRQGHEHFEAQQQTVVELAPLRPNHTKFENQLELAYNPITQNIYLIFKEEIMILTNQNQSVIKRVPINTPSIEGIACSSLFLFVATQKYILIFKTFDDDLILKHNISHQVIYPNQPFKKDFDLTDLTIGGRQGELLYVLDKNNGVVILIVDDYGVRRNEQIGLLEVRGGFKMDQYQDNIVIVLTEGVGSMKHNKAFEFCIDLVKNQWFQLNVHNLNGRTTDIDITKNIAIIRGIDSHRIIYHSIWNAFQPKHQEEQYFYAPQVKYFDFFEINYGKGSFLDWHYNQSHEFIFGVSKYDLVLFPWQEIDAGVQCYSNNYEDLDRAFFYTLRALVSKCDKKRTDAFHVLEACQIESNFTLKVEGIIISEGNKIYPMVIGLCIFLVLFVIIIIFYYQYRRYRFKKAALDREIQGFVSKGFTKSSTQKTDEDLNNL